MQKKITKRALLVSLISLLLCSTMLIGSTFAWFTDTAATSVNKIEAGRLDVQLEYKNSSSEDFSEVTENTNVFLENTLWEPGHLEYVVLRISNGGSLALKYTLGVHVVSETGSRSVQGNEFKLSDYLKFAVLDGQVTNRDTLITAATNGTVLSAGYSAETPKLLPTEEAKLVTLAVWFPSTIGNEANYAAGQEQPKIDLGIDLTATQASHENDSYGNTYDDGAAYPVIITSQSELNEALTNPTDADGNPNDNVSITLREGTFTLPAVVNKTVTISGGENTVLDMTNSSIIGAQNANLDLTVEGVTVRFANENYKGITHSKAVTYKNCIIEGKQFLYAENAKFVDCTFKNTGDYCVWTYGSTNVLFENCEFNTTGKAILVYREGNGNTFVTVNDCTFSGGSSIKAAVETGDNPAKTFNISLDINNCTLNGFTKVWENKNSMPAERLSVTIDGVKVQ